jgi:hypothetical protein
MYDPETKRQRQIWVQSKETESSEYENAKIAGVNNFDCIF